MIAKDYWWSCTSLGSTIQSTLIEELLNLEVVPEFRLQIFLGISALNLINLSKLFKLF